MGLFLKKFENHTQYENYINGSSAILPNVSICTTEGDVHYNPIETRLVAKYNVTDTSNPTRIASGTSNFSAIEIDGIELSNVTTGYTFDTVGEHTVKYTLKNTTLIGAGTFNDCVRLTSIVIPSGVTSISRWTFRNCSRLTSITIPDSVTSIVDEAFKGCSSLTSIVIPSGVTSIGDNAFSDCRSLTSIDIPSGVTYIGAQAFYNCMGLTGNLVIPSGVTSIYQNTFYGCSGLTSIDIPSGVTSIGNYAFSGCTSLTSIDIPSGVTRIGISAFMNCTSFTSVTVNAITPPKLDTDAFRSTNNCPIYVPSGSVETYKAASGWSNLASRIQAIP